MKCNHCLKDVTPYEPFGYCARCNVWYNAEGEETKGVYNDCSNRNDPEKCKPFIQSLISKFKGKEHHGEGIPLPPAITHLVPEADKICAECPNKHFEKLV